MKKKITNIIVSVLAIIAMLALVAYAVWREVLIFKFLLH